MMLSNSEALIQLLPQIIASGLEAAQVINYATKLTSSIAFYQLDISDLDWACCKLDEIIGHK